MVLIERISTDLFVGYLQKSSPKQKYVEHINNDWSLSEPDPQLQPKTVPLEFEDLFDLGFKCRLLRLINVPTDLTYVSRPSFEHYLAKGKELFFKSEDGKVRSAIQHMLCELKRAEQQHPDWPQEAIHAGAVVAEEAGELLRDCVSFDETGDESLINNMKIEAIQTGAMAIRFLKNLSRSQHRTIPRRKLIDVLGSDTSDGEKLAAIVDLLTSS